MRQQNGKFEKQYQDLMILENSLFKAWLIDKQEVVTLKSSVVFKIVDNSGVSPAKAKEYISILESRGVIRTDKEYIYYNPSPERIKKYNSLINFNKESVSEAIKQLDNIQHSCEESKDEAAIKTKDAIG